MSSLFQTVTCQSVENANDQVVPFSSADSKYVVSQSIFIENLEIDMFIGALEEEKKEKQRVIISASFETAPVSANEMNDDINQVVSYADMIEMIERIASKNGHIHLVETFAEMIIDAAFKNSMVLSADVSVKKPDIIKNTSAVGVRFKRAKI